MVHFTGAVEKPYSTVHEFATDTVTTAKAWHFHQRGNANFSRFRCEYNLAEYFNLDDTNTFSRTQFEFDGTPGSYQNGEWTFFDRDCPELSLPIRECYLVTVTDTVTESFTSTIWVMLSTLVETSMKPGPTIRETKTQTKTLVETSMLRGPTIRETEFILLSTLVETSTLPGPTIRETEFVMLSTVIETSTLPGSTIRESAFTTLIEPGPTVTRSTTRTEPGPTVTRSTTLTEPGPTVTRSTTRIDPGLTVTESRTATESARTVTRSTTFTEPGLTVTRGTTTTEPARTVTRLTITTQQSPPVTSTTTVTRIRCQAFGQSVAC
jgi:hypothetical protein